jgi:hypothetical protein
MMVAVIASVLFATFSVYTNQREIDDSLSLT